MMNTNTYYRVKSYESKSIENLDKMLNDFLNSEHGIVAVNISLSSAWTRENDQEYLLYSGTLLYTFK